MKEYRNFKGRVWFGISCDIIKGNQIRIGDKLRVIGKATNDYLTIKPPAKKDIDYFLYWFPLLIFIFIALI